MRNSTNYLSMTLIYLVLSGSFSSFCAQEPDPFLTTDDQKIEFESKITIPTFTSLIWQLKGFNPKKQLHITVVIPSYNNSKWYKKNLDSIFMQQYENFNIIYLDDASTDNTGDLVYEYVKERHQENRVKIIKNQQRVYSLANIYAAVHMCADSDIIATCDGDDWWCNQYVLQTLNKIYQYSNVWVTYGKAILVPGNDLINNAVRRKVIHSNSFRVSPWEYSGLRTFYAWLFKQIKFEDFLYEGKFIESHCDGTYFLPLLEMAGRKQQFISDVFYAANRATGINNYAIKKELQEKMANYIKAKKPYRPIR